MLIEIAIGDAYGAGFEYAKPTKTRPNDLTQFRSHPKWRQVPGAYTDDTEMSIAIAELLVEDGLRRKVKWSPLRVAQKFIDVFHRNGCRTGYAAGFYNFLCNVQDGWEFLDKIRPDSEKSGAAMRACPLGILSDMGEVLEKCELQARVTHHTDAAVTAAQAISLMTHYFIYDLVPKNEMADELMILCNASRFGHNWTESWDKKVGPPGCESVHAAIQAVVTSNSMSEILKKCIDYGGDVDTVAAMAMGAASCSKEITQDLPDGLILNLENGAYGRDFLKTLNTKLMSLKVKGI